MRHSPARPDEDHVFHGRVRGDFGPAKSHSVYPIFMHDPDPVTRRQFLRTSGLALGAMASMQAAPTTSMPWPVIGFTKPFVDLSPEATAALVAEVGWDGIDCPVRKRDTHVAIERVADDLPRMADALQQRGKKIHLVTTDILRLDARAEKILNVVAELGIKRYRLGFTHYEEGRSIPDTVREMSAQLRDLATFNHARGLQGCFQNHSGATYVGAAIWDVWLMTRDLDPSSLGFCFDIGHAMIEGGLSWPTQARLTSPQWSAISLKDFAWEKSSARGWEPRWCPLGEGSVPRQFFENLKSSGFRGPISQHHEYFPAQVDQATLRSALKKDFAQLRSWLS